MTFLGSKAFTLSKYFNRTERSSFMKLDWYRAVISVFDSIEKYLFENFIDYKSIIAKLIWSWDIYILSVLSGSSAQRCKCQRQIRKMETLAEIFANNKTFFLSGLFGVAYLVLAALMWKAYFPSARSVGHKNMMSIVHSLRFIIIQQSKWLLQWKNAGEFRDVKRKGEEEVPKWWNAIYKRITRIWTTSTSRYQYYNIVIAPICCMSFKNWWLLNRLTSVCVFLFLYIISYTLRCFWPHSFLFGYKFLYLKIKLFNLKTSYNIKN